jgi:hypothetical protein
MLLAHDHAWIRSVAATWLTVALIKVDGWCAPNRNNGGNASNAWQNIKLGLFSWAGSVDVETTSWTIVREKKKIPLDISRNMPSRTLLQLIRAHKAN